MQYLQEARTLLGGGRLAGGRKDQLLTTCPFCRGKKFYFNFITGKSECKSGKCERRFGSLGALKKQLKGRNYRPVAGGISGSVAAFNPWGKETLPALPAWDILQAREYLLRRSITKEDSVRANIWAMQTTHTLVFPLHNFRTGESSPYFRRLTGELRWFGDAGFSRVDHCFGAEHLSPGHSVILVEGIFDILTPGLLGLGVSTLGSSVAKPLLHYVARRFSEVVHLPDNDQAGQKSAQDLEKMCRVYRLKYVNVNERGDLYRGTSSKDPGDLGRQDPFVQELIKYVRKRNER